MILEKNINDYIDRVSEIFPSLSKSQIKKTVQVCSNEIIKNLLKNENVAISSYSKIMTINNFNYRDLESSRKFGRIERHYSKRLAKYNNQIKKLKKYERSK